MDFAATESPSATAHRPPRATGRGWLAGLALGAALLAAIHAGAAVLPGIDVLAAQGFAPLRGKRVGLISNPSAITSQGVATWRAIRNADGVRLVSLFGAEHGFDGRARAGEEVRDRQDSETGLPVYSLYGPGRVRQPTPAMLSGIDTLVYDIQDTGCRSYTFISTLGLAMDACARAGVAFVVLDRPNPLGGVRVEGPGLDPRFKSFVGQWPVPYAYGLTPGELARMINGERWISNRCSLTVIPLRGWSRSMTWADTGLRWVPPSPNIPTGNSPLYLVATGILGEIGGLNLGTGSPSSFQVIGASWLDPRRFASRMNAAGLPGMTFEPVALDLNRNARDGSEFQGVRIRLTRPATAPVTSVAFHALEAVKATSGRDLFQLAARRGRSWDMFDKVTGSDRVRRALQQGRSAGEIVASWKPGVEEFRSRRRPYLLYPEPSSAPAGAGPAPSAKPPARRAPASAR